MLYQRTLTQLLCITCISTLSGCMSLMPTHQNDAALAAAQSAQGSMSVDELLNRARGKPSAGYSPSGVAPSSHLLLSFTDETLTLTDDQLQQLNTFANERPAQLISIECAPSSHMSAITAASQAIARCLKVSDFLKRRAHTTQASLKPSLETNHIFIKDAHYTAVSDN